MTFPLESEVETTSDHGIFLTEAKLPRKKAFAWETHYYLQITPQGSENFTSIIKSEDWSTVSALLPDNHRMADEFHKILDAAINKSFAWRKVRRKNSDKPWVSDGLRKRMKQRMSVFRAEGRSEKLSLIHI